MLSPKNLLERAPMVWTLLGLLFFAGGLYLGFEYTMAFWYMMIGAFCCAYGVALFIFRLREAPKSTKDTRLSPNFISGTPHPTATPHGDVSAAEAPAAASAPADKPSAAEHPA